MGKRSNFERNPRDYYRTPEKALLPLLPHIVKRGLVVLEPCAGDGQLSRLLKKYGMTIGWESDIEPQDESIDQMDALDQTNLSRYADIIITNPPWEKRKHKGEICNKLMRHWLTHFHGDIWLLMEASWPQTKQALEFKGFVSKIVPVGRVSWMENGISGKDDCSWYCLNVSHTGGTKQYWRIP